MTATARPPIFCPGVYAIIMGNRRNGRRPGRPQSAAGPCSPGDRREKAAARNLVGRLLRTPGAIDPSKLITSPSRDRNARDQTLIWFGDRRFLISTATSRDLLSPL